MRLGWVYDGRFLLHETGDVHPERPQRLLAIVEALENAGFMQYLERIDFRAARVDQLTAIHEPAYIDIVRTMCDEGFQFIGSPDTQVCARSYDVALLATGGVLAACDAVVAGEVQGAFCAVRPPGHHAESDQAMGFCLFNHVACAAEHLIHHHHFERVAIIDIDVHHGNGTQHAFENRADVLYVSIHERPESLPFPGSGFRHERGIGNGLGFTRNVPMDRGSGDGDYRAAFDDEILPCLDDYAPQFILISCGFDALRSDRIANICLETASYGWMTEQIVQIANRHAQGRLVSVLEGGYDLDHLGQAALAHLQSLHPT
jgi:acetoin utilization deacetylase AcuC-like enzyme